MDRPLWLGGDKHDSDTKWTMAALHIELDGARDVGYHDHFDMYKAADQYKTMRPTCVQISLNKTGCTLC